MLCLEGPATGRSINGIRPVILELAEVEEEDI